jgi:hypothetical protein
LQRDDGSDGPGIDDGFGLIGADLLRIELAAKGQDLVGRIGQLESCSDFIHDSASFLGSGYMPQRSFAGVRSHDNDARLLRELDLGVQQTDDPVLDHANDSHGTSPRAKVRLERARPITGSGVRNRQQWLGGQLLIQGLAAFTPRVRLWCGHRNSLSRR